MLDATVRNDADINEVELLQQVASGNRAAFKILYDIHSANVYKLTVRLLGNPDDAAEITQDIFLSLWKNAGRIRGDSKLSTWLYRVAVNKAINFRKRGGVFTQLKQILSLGDEDDSLVEQLPAAETARPDRQWEARQAEVKLADLLAGLPQRQREIYLQHKLEGLSYKEIAEEMKISLGSVESVMHRAKENLQKIMVKRLKKKSK